jgi:hypothetical protein
MKKNLLVLSALFFSVSLVFGQDKEPIKIPKFGKKEDRVILNFTWDNWLNASSGIKIKDFRSRGFSFLLMNEKILGKGNAAIGFGFGFSSQNVHSNTFPSYSPDGSHTFLSPISGDYDVNKLSCNFLDAALELRFRTHENEKEKRFKVSLGIKGGYLVQSHTKYEDDNGKIKTYNIKNLNKFQYGPTARIAYGNLGISGYYSLVNLFKDGKGPELTPISMGISLAF